MKIESSPDSYIGSVAGGPQKAASASTAGSENAAAAGALAAAQPQAGVVVTLSMASQAMSSAGGTGGTSGEVFNVQKVEAMKLAIANGTFQVNPEAIADKMLSNAAEMLVNTRS